MRSKRAYAVCLLGLVVSNSAAAAPAYKVTVLHPPVGFGGTEVLGVSGASHVGRGLAANGSSHALLWNSTMESVVDLHPDGFGYSEARSVSGTSQVGFGLGPPHALLWNGTAASVVDLHPTGYELTQALGVSGASQVGMGAGPATGGSNHALLWNGTAESVVDLNPPGFAYSEARGVSGASQVGGGDGHALLWHGTAESVVDLHPPGLAYSEARGVSGTIQVGAGNDHALLWRGTAESVVDLHPVGFEHSFAYGVSEAGQVGYGLNFSIPNALLWHGTAESVVDLHSYVVEQLGTDFYWSAAYGIADNGTIVGIATNGIGGGSVLWTPIPEPSSLTLLTLAAAAMMLRRRRNQACAQTAISVNRTVDQIKRSNPTISFAAHFMAISPPGKAIFAASSHFRGDELMRLLHCALLAVLLSVPTASTAVAAASLTPLGDLPGGPFKSYANGVSGDGSVVVGGSSYSVYGYEQAFRWTSDGGMVGLGDLPGSGFLSTAYGVSADGSVIVGWGVSASGQEAFRWTSAGGMVGLGYPPGPSVVDPFSAATGVSGDGSVVVGVGQSDTEHYTDEAFRWTSGGGMGDLGALPAPFNVSAAYGVSGDGLVVVGHIYILEISGPENYEAFRWTSDGGMVLLDGHLFGGSSSAYGVNTDGSVVVGRSASVSGTQAFRWTSGGGMVGLGVLPGNVSSEALKVSGDGSVVVGSSGDNVGYHRAFRWTSGGGMERLWDVLVDHGVDPAADGWTNLSYASGISADGRTIVGTGTRNGNTEAFAAFIPIAPDLPGDFNFDGSVDAADLAQWQGDFGLNGDSDADNDGDSDGNDFLIWQRGGSSNSLSSADLALWRANFGVGASSAAGGAVPEPNARWLAATTVLAMCQSTKLMGRHRNRK